MSLSLGRVVLSAALVAAISCDAPTNTASSAPVVASSTPLGVASPAPTRTPKPDEDQLIVRALARAGIRLTSAFPSKFDWLFGSAAPRSGTFQGVIDGTQVWADVHFLETPVDGIRACSFVDPTRETAFVVSVMGYPQALGGTVTGYLGSAGPMYFAASDRFFVMTPDARVREALRSSLSLSVPSCLWREPATLPMLLWEREVTSAIEQDSGTIVLIGGSKFETFLGDRREARHFGWTARQSDRGAEVLYLPQPLGDLRMCSAPSTPGFTKWTVTLDGKSLPGMEGSQIAYPLVGPRFFVLAFDADSAAVLSRSLGISAPPC
jgi:hypothetical protein